MTLSRIDVVSSALNEEDCIDEFLNRVHLVMSTLPQYDYRVIIIDNGSQDFTWQKIVDAAHENPRILGIQMSRTFSFDSALTCGLDHADGDFVILMTSDLQDPPETIPRMLEEINQGFDQVVVSVARRDSVPIVRRILSSTFYRVANWVTKGLIPRNVSDFRIMNRAAYRALRSLRESHRFLRGLGAWVGFKTSTITIDRPLRFAGESKWLATSLSSVISNALQGILAHSTRPLQWLALSSIFMSTVSLFSIPPLFLFWITSGVPFAGFGWIMTLIILSFALMMLTLGTLSLFITLIYEEVKQRPLYLVRAVTKIQS